MINSGITNMTLKTLCRLIKGTLGIGVILCACENTLDPLDDETGFYSIYGTLDLNEETNYIRVRDLHAPFTAEATQKLDAEVSLENLGSGDTDVLESQRTEYEGVYQYNFVVNRVIQPDTEYRLTIKRSDGITVAVTTTTPTKPDPVVTPDNPDCYTPIEVEFSTTNGGTIVYNIGIVLFQASFGTPQVLKSDENNSESLSFTFTPIDIISSIRPGSSLGCQDLNSENFIVFYTHYGPGLYEKIVNDPFDIMQSIERFGSYYRERMEILVDTSRICPPDC